MSPSDLDDMLAQHPFVPLRLTLSSGDQLIIDNPVRTMIVGHSLYVDLADDPAARIGQRLRAVSIPNIELVEQVDPRPRRNGRKRRP